MLEVIDIVLMLLVPAYIISIVFVGFEISDLKRKIDGFYAPYNDMFSKVNGLFAKDHHDTERPKIDILSDEIDNKIDILSDEIDNKIDILSHEVWIGIKKLSDRIIELEKK